MTHILERHHPSFWDGSVKTTQTFLDKNLSIDDVTDLVRRTIQQGYETRVAEGSRVLKFTAEINGVTYLARTEYGKVVQFYPLPK